MAVQVKPSYTVRASILAKWIETQPDRWWIVDGDPLLTSLLDFPCPSDELAPVIRNIGKDLLLHGKRDTAPDCGEIVDSDKLDQLCDTGGRHREKTLGLCWADSDVDWLLIEDKDAVRQFGTGQ